MFYNKKGFGNEIQQLRRSMNLSREELSDLTYIGIDTLKNIESGKVLPNLETLDIISVVLKRDLSQLLLEYRFIYP
jgi:transcriptional regulator with XRE-family HTH domain